MALSKTFTNSLIKKLNKACETFRPVCDQECENLGWCQSCWVVVKCGKEDAMKRKGCGK
jgi:hypothetical protein